MPKNDRASLRKKELAFWNGRKGAVLPPLSSYHPVPYLFRQCRTFRDALRRWAVEKPDNPTVLQFGFLAEAKAAKKVCAKTISAALGPYGEDLDGAEKATEEWRCAVREETGLDPKTGAGPIALKHIPLINTLWEINTALRPLLSAYRNPEQFFREIAPALLPRDFDFQPGKLTPSDAPRLGETLRVWGRAALLHPGVRAAFETFASHPRLFAEVLNVAEQRKAYKEGRGKGVRDGATSKRRVAHARRLRRVEHGIAALRDLRDGSELRAPVKRAARFVAGKDGVSEAAIRKSMTLARKAPKSTH
jgi:hypothetical protein